ncbi:hypothetical protein GCM10023196_036750 [Actinoallomurus vinaceus]|uniref:Uncharacterized protein n=1 Tax=Actinoallomurus vinaceus TaxID=1080074 RepID=A0ABP8UAS4_9ACTN
MATPADEAFLRDAVISLCGPLHDGLETAREIAESHFDEYEMTDPEYRPGVTHLTRFHLRRILKATDLGPWEVTSPRPNGQVKLRNDLLTLQLLHEWPSDDVPPPGKNEARIDYYRNPDLQLYGTSASNLIGVWRRLPDGEVGVRIVRPVKQWKVGKKAIVDIDFPLPREEELLKDLEFTPNDVGMELLLPVEGGIEGGISDANDANR